MSWWQSVLYITYFCGWLHNTHPASASVFPSVCSFSIYLYTNETFRQKDIVLCQLHNFNTRVLRVNRSELKPDAHLLHRPEGGLGLLVHLPDVGVLDGEDDKPSWVFSEQRFVVLMRTIVAVCSIIFEEVLNSWRWAKTHTHKKKLLFSRHTWQFVSQETTVCACALTPSIPNTMKTRQ